MRKGDRTSSKPSSSARAAEVLASKAGGGGFGFGGYAGSSLLGPNVAGFGFGAAAAERLAPAAAGAEPSGGADYSGGEVPLTTQVDGELAQCIRHLTKKDPITKTKALQNLRALIPSRSTADLVTAMPPWIYMYNRLIMDPSRAVRSETAATLACLLTALGKSVAPHLKALIGPWFLAMYDTYGDAADASRAAFAAAFLAARRQLDVVLYCRTELMSYLKDQLAATPQQLGDAKKDSPEELEERHERVQAACLAALAALITMMTAPPDGTASTAGEAAPPPPVGRDEVLAAVRDLLCRPGFWKGTAGSKSATVRRSSYGLARCAAQRAAKDLLEGCAAESAVCVLGALGEKEPGNHGAMWEVVLTYGKFFPNAWRHVNLRKMLLPRLYSLLRHGCFGSAPVSLPALLPLLPLLPPGTLGPGPDVMAALLEAVWAGMQDPACAARAAKAASLSAYRECLAWGLANSARLAVPAAAADAAAAPAGSGGDAAAAAEVYCRALLKGSLAQHALPAALGLGASAEAARELLVGLALGLAAAPVPLACMTEAVGGFVSGALESRVAAATAAAGGGAGGDAEGELVAACEGAAALLAQLRRDAAAGCRGLAAQVAAAAARGLMSAGPSGLPPAASQLLATLLREYGNTAAAGARPPSPEPGQAGAAADAVTDADAAVSGRTAQVGGAGIGSFSLESLVAAFKSGPISGAPAEAAADVLVAFCTTHDNPPALWESVLATMLPQRAGQDQGAEAAEVARGEELQRVLMLLQRCTAAAGAGAAAATAAAKGDGVQPAAAAAEPSGWGSAALDALAVRLARRGGSKEAPAADGAAAALLSLALGANVAGLVMLRPPAARDVVQALTEHLAAATAPGGGGAAAGLAVCVLSDPLSSGSCGLWALLPDPVCDALVTLAQLSWEAPCSRPTGHTARGHLRHGGAAGRGGEDSSSGNDAEEDGEEDEESEEDEVALAATSDDAETDEEAAEEEEAAALRAARSAAARFWRDGRPLAAAAAALPRGRVDELVRRLAGVLAAAAAAARLSPRSWAAHVAQLLAAAPGGAAQRQGMLDVLLAARREWLTWSGLAAAAASSAAAGALTSGAGQSVATMAAAGGGAGGRRPEPSLEYVARLAEAAGPGALLGGAFEAAKEDEDEEKAKGGGEGSSTGGRCWVLVELLCGHHAAAAAAEHQQRAGPAEEVEEEEPGLSGAWRRAVGRAAEALLEHIVYGSVGEVEAGEDGGGSCRGVYGGLLRSLVDGLAEGCRDGGSLTSTAAQVQAIDDGALSPTQAAFLDALCHVAALLERASSSSGDGAHGDADQQQPPLLPHQQRLCRHWLSTCRPDAATRTGLPPPALLRLLPMAAGPVRRAAAAAAADARRGGAAAAEEVLAASGLPELSCAWVRHCLSRPAVLLEPTESAVTALELAAACFPAPDARGGGSSSSGAGARAAAAALTLARSGGAGLAASERPLLKQLVNHQLVRHAGMAAARGQQADAGATGPTAAADPAAAAAAAAAARAVVMRLAHAAVVYDWRSLGQPEWHALLQAVQDRMAEAVAALTTCLDQLAAAARSAADGVLQQPPGSTPPGPMALQLLRKLAQRGVLGRVPQGRQLEAAAEAALGGCGLGPAARGAAQLAAVLTELHEEVAADAGGGTAAGAAAASREYGNTMQACCSHAMQLAIGLGGVECYGQAFGPVAAVSVAAWLSRHREFWAAVTRCASRALAPGREHLGAAAGAAAVAAQASALEAAGLDAVGALLAVALTCGSHMLQPVAYRLLLGDALLPQLTLAETAAAAAGVGGSAADIELPEYGGDDVAFLGAGGVRPEMTPWLLTAAANPLAAGGGDRVYLTAWALLLAHALDLDTASRGLAVLRQVLREVEPLVHGLLDQLVPELGLQRQQQSQRKAGNHHRQHQHHGRSGGAGGGDGADVERWRLAEVLREIGLPLGPHAVRATCRMLYRAVLRALPATARGWFGDLRDRGLAAAVESYTAAAEGPALLAAEIASVQALKRRGGDDRFTVRASPASREVAATLEVEDGAVLELVVKLPACLPLRAPEVECRRKVGVNDTRLRKWLLSIATFLRHQNGSVADAIGLWKRNVDSEFEGVEACLICYSVISSVNGQLPRLVCRTCNVRFHPACLYKWFKSAGKSQCPHCQALW